MFDYTTSWWFQPLRKLLVKMGNFPKVRGENKKYLSCHHPDKYTKFFRMFHLQFTNEAVDAFRKKNRKLFVD